MFKVIVTGGQDFDNYKELSKYLKKMFKNKTDIEIVSATEKGADSLGEKFAIDNNLGLKSFPAPYTQIKGRPKNQIKNNSAGKKIWKLAPSLNIMEMIEYANAMVIFSSNKDSDINNYIEIAKKKQIPLRIKNYETNET